MTSVTFRTLTWTTRQIIKLFWGLVHQQIDVIDAIFADSTRQQNGGERKKRAEVSRKKQLATLGDGEELNWKWDARDEEWKRKKSKMQNNRSLTEWENWYKAWAGYAESNQLWM